MKKAKYETTAHLAADQLLAEIAAAQADLSKIENNIEQCFEGVRLAFKESADEAKERFEAAEKKLIRLAKKYHGNLFGAGDDERTDLPAGALLYKEILRVIKARSITPELLEEKGYPAAVKIAKSVNWDEIKKWSDIKLAEIGTERKLKKSYEYELSTKDTKKDTKDEEDKQKIS